MATTQSSQHQKDQAALVFTGETLLWAARENNLETVTDCLSHGVDPNYKDPTTQKNALDLTSSPEILRILLNHPNLSTDSVTVSQLRRHLKSNNTECVALLLMALDPDEISNYLETQRLTARQREYIEYFLKRGAPGRPYPTPASTLFSGIEKYADNMKFLRFLETRNPKNLMTGLILSTVLTVGLAPLAATGVLVASMCLHSQKRSVNAAIQLNNILKQQHNHEDYCTVMSQKIRDRYIDKMIAASDRWSNDKDDLSLNVLLCQQFATQAGRYSNTETRSLYFGRQFGPKHAPSLKAALQTGIWSSPDEFNSVQTSLRESTSSGILGFNEISDSAKAQLSEKYKSLAVTSTHPNSLQNDLKFLMEYKLKDLELAAFLFHWAFYPIDATTPFPEADPTHQNYPRVEKAFMGALLVGADLAVKELLDSLSPEDIKKCLALKTYGGRSPLMIAVQSNHWKLVNILLEKGADLFAKDDKGLTVFDIAKLIECSKEMTLVLAAHAPFNTPEISKLDFIRKNPSTRPAFSDDYPENHVLKILRIKLNAAINAYAQDSQSRRAGCWILEELDQFLEQPKPAEGSDEAELERIHIDGFAKKLLHLATKTGEHVRRLDPNAFASPESLCMLILKEYGYALPKSRLSGGRYRLTLTQLQEALIALMYGPEAYAKKQREADVETGSSGTAEYKSDSSEPDSSSASESQALLDDHIQTILGINRKPCFGLSDQEIDQLLAGFSSHLWSGDKQTHATMDGVVLNALLRNDLLNDPIRTPEQKRDLADFIINQCQDYLKGRSKPATTSRDDREDLCKAIGTDGKITSGKLKEILSQFSTLHPSFDKEFNGQPERNKAMEKNRNTVVKNLLSFRKDCTDAEAMMIRFNHFLNLNPQNRLGSLPGWFYMGTVFRLSSDGKSHYARVGKEALEAYEANKSEASFQASKKFLTAYVGTLKGPSLIGPIDNTPGLIEALNALDRAWQSRRPTILKALRGEEAMVGPLYHTHPKSSHPELAALQTQIDQLVRLQDMIFTLVYENPHHLDPKKNSHITPQLQACLEMIRGPQIRFNTDPPYHGLNLNHLETVQLATLLLNNIPAPEADQKAQGAPEAKAEDAVSEVSLHEPARPAASFTPAQLTELSLVIQELVANNHNEAGLKSLRDRILVLQQGNHTQPQDIVTCFLGTARERLSKTREANFPEAQKAAGASASEHEPTEQLGAAKRSGMEKFSTAMSALTRSRNTQAVYEAAVALMDSPSSENIKGIKKAIDAYIGDKARVETWRKRIQASKSETAKEILLPEIDRAIQNGTVLSEIVHRDEAIRSGQKLTAIQLYVYISSAKAQEYQFPYLADLTLAMSGGNQADLGEIWSAMDTALDAIRTTLQPQDETLLMLAVRQGNHDAVLFLIEKLRGMPHILASLLHNGNSTVFNRIHDLPILQTLLNNIPAEVTYHLINQPRKSDGYTPLELAIQENNLGLVNALLRAGADPHQISKVTEKNGATIADYHSTHDDLSGVTADIRHHLLIAGAKLGLNELAPSASNALSSSPTNHAHIVYTTGDFRPVTSSQRTINSHQLQSALFAALNKYETRFDNNQEVLKDKESYQIGMRALRHLHYLNAQTGGISDTEMALIAESIKALSHASGQRSVKENSLIVLSWKAVLEALAPTGVPPSHPSKAEMLNQILVAIGQNPVPEANSASSVADAVDVYATTGDAHL